MISALLLSVIVAAGCPRFTDITDPIGLGLDNVPPRVARACFADLTGNGWPDLIIDRHLVFLSASDPNAPAGRRFDPVPPKRTGLLPPERGTVTVFVDLYNSGRLDAVVAEYVDLEYPGWEDHGRRTGWHRGRGDGTFRAREPLPVEPRTTVAIAAGDVTRNGFLDLYFGNAYRQYGLSFEAYENDLLINNGQGGWVRMPLPEDDHEFTTEHDLGGRPTYGAMILNNPVGEGVMLLELSYGRRWNRAWVQEESGRWRDVAPALGLDGDAIRHGRHPEWLRERAKTDPRFDRQDERPFRANGNTFDAAVGDVDGDGHWDFFISEITHGWAGDSSDRSRFLFYATDEAGAPRYTEREGYNVDRIPPAPDDPAATHNWNHGDLFCELADLDHSGYVDLVLSSGDYPDDQRLRIYRNTGAAVNDVTSAWGLHHDGSQQISLADVTGDGALDLVAGQTFNRFRPEQREGRTPQLRLWRNRAPDGRGSVVLRLVGDGRTVNRSAIGAEVWARIGDRVLLRQLIGPGGHAGKQHDFVIHFGLGEAAQIDELTITWPDRAQSTQRFENITPGTYRLEQSKEPERFAR